MKHFYKENVFPNEAFIQEALEKYFIGNGYEVDNEQQVDLIAVKSPETWLIEAKGITSQVGLDFNTCIGQIVKHMDSDSKIYAIAVPMHVKYQKQCSFLSSYFREWVNLNILLVNELGEVQRIRPNEDTDEYWK